MYRIPWVDASVAKVRKILADAGVEKETLILFTSDNGPKHDQKELAKHDHDSSGPYRGYKTDVWDGGTRSLHRALAWRADLSQSGQLYDIEIDPSEQNNLYHKHPKVVKRLTAKMRTAIVSGRTTEWENGK